MLVRKNSILDQIGIALHRSVAMWMFLVVVGFSLIVPSVAIADDEGYAINPGDGLLLSVWREEGLSIQVLVAPDGNCTFPLIGQIRAAGRTAEDMTVEMVERLSRFIPDPVVTVSVVDISGNKIYVIGQVTNPGAYNMNPVLDVMQALSVAGGTTPFAELNDIKILRRVGEQQSAIAFRYNDILRGRNLEQNVMLQSGDTIVVP